MKNYIITLSKTFPVTHARAGQPTDFKEKLLAAINSYGEWMKNHTLRANYELWKKRFEEIDAGRACLSIRQWTGKPYASKQVELMRLTREDGIGLQKLCFLESLDHFTIDGIEYEGSIILAHNDGLEYNDWKEWFKSYDLSQPMAVIHFTKFRY